MLLLNYYKWQIILKDGSNIYQKDGKQFKFNNDNKDFANIKTFILLPEDKTLNKIILNLPDNARLIFFRRTIGSTGNVFPRFHVNIAGWQTTINNTNVKYISYIFPDGTIENDFGDEPTYTDYFINKLPKQAPSIGSDCIECIKTK